MLLYWALKYINSYMHSIWHERNAFTWCWLQITSRWVDIETDYICLVISFAVFFCSVLYIVVVYAVGCCEPVYSTPIAVYLSDISLFFTYREGLFSYITPIERTVVW